MRHAAPFRALAIAPFLLLLAAPAVAEEPTAGEKEVEVKLGAEEEEARPDAPAGNDPFSQPRPESRPPCEGLGVKCFEVAELDLIGIVVTKDAKETYAILQGPDNKGYNLKMGDEVRNGKLKTIEKDRVVFEVKSGDPLDPKPFRDLEKRLEPKK